MKIIINISKKEIEHLKEHTFEDCCISVWDVMNRIQKEIIKRGKNGKRKKT